MWYHRNQEMNVLNSDLKKKKKEELLMKKTFGQVDKIVENHFISSEGIWNHCSRLEGAH